MDTETYIRAEVTRENGQSFPQFTFVVRDMERFGFLANFYLTPMPINVELLKNLHRAGAAEIPDDAALRMELTWEDVLPDNAYEVHLTLAEVNSLARANYESRRLRFRMEKSDGRQSVILHDLYPYHVDWHGVHGICFFSRVFRDIKPSDADIQAGYMEQHLRENGYATGLLNEMGLMWKIAGNHEKSRDCYVAEINYTADDSGKLTIGSMKPINNLATLLKNHKQFEASRRLYKHALSINPNYFEALVSVAGVVGDVGIAIRCLARAERIRPQNDFVTYCVQAMNEEYGMDMKTLGSQVCALAESEDLSVPIPGLEPEDNWKDAICAAIPSAKRKWWQFRK